MTLDSLSNRGNSQPISGTSGTNAPLAKPAPNQPEPVPSLESDSNVESTDGAITQVLQAHATDPVAPHVRGMGQTQLADATDRMARAMQDAAQWV